MANITSHTLDGFSGNHAAGIEVFLIDTKTGRKVFRSKMDQGGPSLLFGHCRYKFHLKNLQIQALDISHHLGDSHVEEFCCSCIGPSTILELEAARA